MLDFEAVSKAFSVAATKTGNAALPPRRDSWPARNGLAERAF
jgi:hypothetical protein